MKKVLCILLSALLITAALTGCSAAKSESAAADSAMSMNQSASTAAGGAAPSEPQAMKESESGWDSGSDYAAADTELAPAAPAGESELPSGNGLPANTKLIYTAEIDMETTKFDTAVSELQRLVSAAGGYFESSQLNNYSNYRRAYYTIRVPAEQYFAFCEAVGTLCQVNNIYQSAEDISEAYYDTEARLVTQQTKLERLQELLANAENMEDIITIETAISETELMIENLTGTLRKYDSLVGYSTVRLSLNEVYELTEVEQPVIGFGARLAAAFRSGANSFVDGLKDLALSFAYNWTGVLIFLVIAGAVVVVIVRIVRKKRREDAAYYEMIRERRPGAKKEEKKDEES